MKTINTQRQFGKRKAFSAILITLVLVGAGLGMTFAAIFTLTDVFESSSSIASVTVSNQQLRVLGSETYLSLNIKNVGTEKIEIDRTYLLYDNVGNAPFGPGTDVTDSIVAISTIDGTCAGAETTLGTLDSPQPATKAACESTTLGKVGTWSFDVISIDIDPGATVSIRGPIEDSGSILLEKGETFAVIIEGKSGDNNLSETITTRAR